MSSNFNTAQFKRTTKKAFRSWPNWAVGFNQNMQIQKKKKKKRDKCGTLSLIVTASQHCARANVSDTSDRLCHCGIDKRWALVAACSSRGDNQEAGPMWSPRRVTDTFENILVFLNQRPCQRGHQRWTVRRANTVQLLLEWKKVVLLWYSEDIVIWNLKIRTQTPETDRFPSDQSECCQAGGRWAPLGWFAELWVLGLLPLVRCYCPAD